VELDTVLGERVYDAVRTGYLRPVFFKKKKTTHQEVNKLRETGQSDFRGKLNIAVDIIVETCLRYHHLLNYRTDLFSKLMIRH